MRMNLLSCRVVKGSKIKKVLFLFFMLFCTTFINNQKACAQDGDVPLADIRQYFDPEALKELQLPADSWQLDKGSLIQIRELLAALRSKNLELQKKYETQSEEFDRILKRKNVNVTKDFGKATRMLLELSDNVFTDYVLVSLKNSRGEPLEVLIVDQDKIPAEHPELYALIAHKLTYEPYDASGKRFGKSVHLVVSPWEKHDVLDKHLENPDSQVYFRKGKNAKAWRGATFFKPEVKKMVALSWSTTAQLVGTLGVGALGHYLGVSETSMLVALALNTTYSTVISLFPRTYRAFTREGRYLKRYLFSVLATSVSFSMLLNFFSDMYLHGEALRKLRQLETWGWIGLNAFAHNFVRTSQDDFSNFLDSTKLVDGNLNLKIKGKEFSIDKVFFLNQMIYSMLINPLRLLDLTVRSVGQSSGEGTVLAGKLGVKLVYLSFAATIQWSVLRFAEVFAAHSRVTPDFERSVDKRAINEKSALLRKKIQEQIDGIRRIPQRLSDLYYGRTIDKFNHARVNDFYTKWTNARVEYSYRLDLNRQEEGMIPEYEIANYRTQIAESIIDIAAESTEVHPFDHVEDLYLKSYFQTRGSLVDDWIEERIKLSLTAHGSDEDCRSCIFEYAQLLREMNRVVVGRFGVPNQINEAHRAVVSQLMLSVSEFEQVAPLFTAQYLELNFSKKFGVYAGKGVEFYQSRIVMWRYLYGKAKALSLDSQDSFMAMLQRDRSKVPDEMGAFLATNRAHIPAVLPIFSPFQKELNELDSLNYEFMRKVNAKLEVLAREKNISVETLKNSAEYRSLILSYLSDEIIAYHAFQDYKQTFAQRWHDKLTYAPDPYWHYMKAVYEKADADASQGKATFVTHVDSYVKNVNRYIANVGRIAASCSTIISKLRFR